MAGWREYGSVQRRSTRDRPRSRSNAHGQSRRRHVSVLPAANTPRRRRYCRCPGDVWDTRWLRARSAAGSTILAPFPDDRELRRYNNHHRAFHFFLRHRVWGDGTGTGRMAYQHRVDGRRDRFGELEHPCRASQHRWKPDHDHRDRRGERHGVAAAIGDAAATAYGGATHEPSAANETDDTNEPGTNTGSGRAHNPSHPGVAHAATAPFTGRQDTTLAPHYLSRVQHHCDVGERHLSPGARGGQCRSYLGHLENFNWDLRPRNWNDELGSREHSAPLRQQRGHHPGI